MGAPRTSKDRIVHQRDFGGGCSKNVASLKRKMLVSHIHPLSAERGSCCPRVGHRELPRELEQPDNEGLPQGKQKQIPTRFHLRIRLKCGGGWKRMSPALGSVSIQVGPLEKLIPCCDSFRGWPRRVRKELKGVYESGEEGEASGNKYPGSAASPLRIRTTVCVAQSREIGILGAVGSRLTATSPSSARYTRGARAKAQWPHDRPSMHTPPLTKCCPPAPAWSTTISAQRSFCLDRTTPADSKHSKSNGRFRSFILYF
jgi:hypothetical protein